VKGVRKMAMQQPSAFRQDELAIREQEIRRDVARRLQVGPLRRAARRFRRG
jgi:hypothetical protein